MRERRSKVFRYAGMETGDDRVGGGYPAKQGQKAMAGEVVHRMERGEGGAGPISRLRKNKLWSLGTEWPMSEVRTPPPHNLNKHHGLVASNNNNNNNNNNNIQVHQGGLLGYFHPERQVKNNLPVLI